jgi:hypothetical protein
VYTVGKRATSHNLLATPQARARRSSSGRWRSVAAVALPALI